MQEAETTPKWLKRNIKTGKNQYKTLIQQFNFCPSLKNMKTPLYKENNIGE